MIKILLACGIGASSGFMAANMRKYAKKQGIDAKISAVSKSEVLDHLGEFDVLLLGPHFVGEVGKFQEELKSENVKVMSINPDYYASLNAEGVLNDAINLLDGKER